MVARVAMALDPPAPIRYRGMSVQFDGLGAALAAAISDTASIQSLAELMRRGLPFQWRQAQVAPAPNPAAAASAEQGSSTQLLFAERLLRWMESAAAGQGFERCLYELNANIPCRSPLLAASWVGNPSDLLKALEVTARSAPGVPPADRHIAAFLAARGRSDIANHLIAICAGKRDPSAVIGMMTAYAWMQRTANVGGLPKLAAWCLTYLKPAVEAYHYRPLRAKIDQRVSDAAREGDLTGMLTAVDNVEQLRRDEAGFRAAVGEFARAEHEVHVCTTRGDDRAGGAPQRARDGRDGRGGPGDGGDERHHRDGRHLMARARAAAIPAKGGKKKKVAGKRRGTMMAIWIAALVVAVVLLATAPMVAMFIGAGLAPTLTAALIDRDPEKHAAVSVGSLNLAGLSPYVIRMFTHPGAAQQMMSDMFVWLVVYAAAAVGWGFYLGFPIIAVRLADIRAEWRVRDMKRRQEKLIEDWGPEVADPDKAQR